MRCNTLFYAILLPRAAFAQSGSPTIHPTGQAPGRNPSPGWDNSAHTPRRNHSHLSNESLIEFNHASGHPAVSSGISIQLPANKTGMYTASYAPKPTSETHQPFTKSSGLLFANATSGFTTLTGTGVSKASRLGPYTRPSNVPKPVVTSSSGHLPYTRSAGAMFTNTTSGVAEQTSSGLFHPSGTGVSSGFAHPSGTTLSSAFVTPTGKNRCHLSSTSRPAAGRLPFSKSAGLVFTNSTSDAAGPTDGAFAHPSGTGVSSGFARPTEFTGVTRSSPMSKSPSATPIAEYYQCGGINWKGNGTCGEGTVCKSWHPYYSQCVSEA